MTTAIKQGRPLKSEHERRTQHAEMWLSPSEHEHLLSSAGRQRPADFLRELALRDWAPSAAQQSGRRGRPPQAKRIQFRVTFSEQEQLKSRASKAQMSVSEYLRLALVVHSGYDAEKHVLRLEVRPGLGKKLAQLAAARNQSVAAYVLDQAEADPVVGAVGKKGNGVEAGLLMRLDRVKFALDRIGKNYNQIAAATSCGRDLPGLDAATAASFREESGQLATLIEEVANRYAG